MNDHSVIFSFCLENGINFDKRKSKILLVEASRGAGAQSVTVKSTGCGFDPHSMK